MTWGLAAKARTPDQLASRAKPPPPSRITVAVRWERLTRSVHVQCTTEATSRVSIPIPPSAENIVTGIPTKRGNSIAEGKPVLEIASRPVIVVQGVLPAFRDLQPGLTGPDVKQFQRALARLGLLESGQVTGVFDKKTSLTVDDFYKYAGYPPPSQSQGIRQPDTASTDTPRAVTVPRQEILVVHHLPARLGVLKAKLGSKLHAGDAVVESGRLRLRCPIVADGDVKLRAGEPATAASPQGKSFRAEVDSVRKSTQSDTQKPADQSPSQVSDKEPSSSPIVYLHTANELKQSGTYQADIVVEQAEHTGAVVPASALWERPGGHTVVIVRRGDQEHDVTVETGMEIDGEVEITSGDLREGDHVVVSDANTGTNSP
ncbi:peptidoglycan-binding protein [Actinoallomurus sp. CA-142502]|uniref:peptidoglycan-binding protein n=1 Tax=Actinoallomurus sp. CA-142502 TaxID=3239885 RepID=UPI003D8AAC7A